MRSPLSALFHLAKREMKKPSILTKQQNEKPEAPQLESCLFLEFALDGLRQDPSSQPQQSSCNMGIRISDRIAVKIT